MRGWRSVVAGACALVVAAGAVAGCGSSSGGSTTSATTAKKSGKKVNIAFACATPTIPFFGPIEQGAKDAAAEAGVNLSYTGIGASAITPAAMSSVLTAAINQHPDALVVCNFFPPAEDPLIRKAVANGIPVFGSNSITNLAADGALSAFGQPDEQAGEGAGNQMAAAGVKHGLCVDDVPNNPSVSARCTGFEKALKAKDLKATTLNLANANNNPTAILSDVKGALRADSSIDGVLALGVTQGPASVQAVAQAGRAGKVKVGTFDISADVINLIKNGSMMFTVWQQPYLQGYMPVLSAAQYLRNGMTLPGEVATGPSFVTKQNVNAVSAAQAAGLS